MSVDCFFRRVSGASWSAPRTFQATPFTSGPWSPLHQHGGPPIALLVSGVEEVIAAGDVPFVIASVSAEFSRPVAVGPLTVEIQPVRRGKTVQSFSARLTHEGVLALRVDVLALATASDLPEVTHERPLLARPPSAERIRFPFRWGDVSYQDAIDLRLASGAVGSGAAAAWLEPLMPLVDETPMSPLAALALIADASNGVSAPLSTDAFDFINPNLLLSLARPPTSTRFLVESETRVATHGVGLVDARISDERGFVARLSQSLLIRHHTASAAKP